MILLVDNAFLFCYNCCENKPDTRERSLIMGNLMEIIARGFSIGDLDAYLKLATGEVNMDTLFGLF